MGTKQGKIADDVWKENIKNHFDTRLPNDLKEIHNLINNSPDDFEKMHNIAYKLSQDTKVVGFMRLACILEHMRKSITPDKVTAKNHKPEQFKGMWPILKQEELNAIYVKHKLLNEPVDM